MSVYRRNGLIAAGADTDNLVLKHHWNAADGLKDGKWIDRVTGTAYFPVQQSWVEDGGIHLRQDEWTLMDGLTTPMNLGRRFRVEVDACGMIVPKAGHSQPWVVLIDFCSLGGYATGFGMMFSNLEQWFSVDAKPATNGDFKSGTFAVAKDAPLDGTFILEHIPVNESQDVWRLRFGDIDISTAPAKAHEMNGMNPKHISLNVGANGNIYWGAQYYSHDILYREIRIYVEP